MLEISVCWNVGSLGSTVPFTNTKKGRKEARTAVFDFVDSEEFYCASVEISIAYFRTHSMIRVERIYVRCMSYHGLISFTVCHEHRVNSCISLYRYLDNNVPHPFTILLILDSDHNLSARMEKLISGGFEFFNSRVQSSGLKCSSR